MADQKTPYWGDTIYKDEMILYAESGEAIAHIFPRQGKGGFTLLTKDAGQDWNYKGQHYDQLLSAQHYALEHGKTYYEQETQNLTEMSRNHLMLDIQAEWERMGGDPRTMSQFKQAWDRASAADLKTKVAAPDLQTDHDVELDR